MSENMIKIMQDENRTDTGSGNTSPEMDAPDDSRTDAGSGDFNAGMDSSGNNRTDSGSGDFNAGMDSSGNSRTDTGFGDFNAGMDTSGNNRTDNSSGDTNSETNAPDDSRTDANGNGIPENDERNRNFSSSNDGSFEEQYIGTLQVNVVTASYLKPIEGAAVQIVLSGAPEETTETAATDESGQTRQIPLRTPPLSYSMEPREYQPYGLYTVRVSAAGYEPVEVSGIEIYPGQDAVQNISMEDAGAGDFEEIVIPANTLYGSYPPKIPEAEIKPVPETGEIVLSRVVIPEYIIVHDGPPSDSRARNYYVRYTDYIKNVASSEIYATWPDATLRANILAIQSFTLNRVYTEWYRNQGYDFTITSSTAYDHKWNYGQTFYTSISRIVDEMFANYLSRPNVSQPILTQYCDGRQVTCDNWMSQWGSKYLGDRGYSAIEILRYYYGSDIYINTAEEISGVPASWPRVTLTVGSTGSKVRQIQEELNAISRSYPAIPSITADGIYGSRTQEAVRKFQSVFGLPVTGDIDYATWYKISAIYVATTRIAELR